MLKVVDRSANLRKLAFDVICGDVVILKSAVDPKLVTQARNAIHEWGMAAPASVANGGATHRASYLPPRSEARYIFHSYDFNPTIGTEIFENVRPLFEELRVIYCDLIGHDYKFGVVEDGYTLLPQCIHYPRGGGFFQEHFHSLRPQLIGLILSGSTLGTDYLVGGGRFRDVDGKWINTEGHHDLGDLTLFKFDIGHDITPIDPDQALNWKGNDGRWSFVLPIKMAPNS